MPIDEISEKTSHREKFMSFFYRTFSPLISVGLHRERNFSQLVILLIRVKFHDFRTEGKGFLFMFAEKNYIFHVNWPQFYHDAMK